MSNDLIARLEAATGPDRELDAAIALTVGLDIGRSRAHSQDSRVSAYTASIDAALTLVPGDDWEWFLEREHTEHLWSGSEWTHRAKLGDPLLGYEGEAATPALAICIAALKARGDA